MISLEERYPHILWDDGSVSIGGDQGRSADRRMRRCGCGAVAGADLMLSLCRTGPSGRRLPGMPEGELLQDNYVSWIDAVRRRFLPVMYPFGMNGLQLAFGVNRMLRRAGIPLRAKWGVPRRELDGRVREMLGKNIPVIMCIGPCFPKVWDKRRVSLYRRDRSGELRRVSGTRTHYLTVCGIEDDCFAVRSWGRGYLIRREEYLEYCEKHSTRFYSNILYLKEK